LSGVSGAGWSIHSAVQGTISAPGRQAMGYRAASARSMSFSALHGQVGRTTRSGPLPAPDLLRRAGSGSALGMDRSRERIAASIRVPIPQYVAFTREDWRRHGMGSRGVGNLSLPVFVTVGGRFFGRHHETARLVGARDGSRECLAI
jgi:hypothetical protein